MTSCDPCQTNLLDLSCASGLDLEAQVVTADGGQARVAAYPGSSRSNCSISKISRS